MLSSQTTSIFTVSRLNQTVRLLLEQEMGQVWISGEISNFTQPSSGHWYFTLKDDTAQVRCAMFRNSNRRVTFRPQHGQQVLVRANITLYEPRGDYQIIVESMQPAGEGLLQQKYEQLKAKLQAEGLFDQQFKNAALTGPLRRGDHLENRGSATRYSPRIETPRPFPARYYLSNRCPGRRCAGADCARN